MYDGTGAEREGTRVVLVQMVRAAKRHLDRSWQTLVGQRGRQAVAAERCRIVERLTLGSGHVWWGWWIAGNGSPGRVRTTDEQETRWNGPV